MQNTASFYLKRFLTRRTKFKRAIAVLLLLSLIVSFAVTWQLKLTGITMAGDAFCGIEEHTHTEECFDKTLICTEDTSNNHTHSDECYEEQKTLICEEEHEHTDACYKTEQVLICTLRETEHIHTEECYEKKLVCEKEEHTHIVSCYSNKEADVETASVWKATLPSSLSGMWTEDLIDVAKSQIGYTESKQNYAVDENKSLKGYTRYGEWYGNKYGDWDAMFVSFCLHYADIPQEYFPYAAGSFTWTERLMTEGLFETPDDYVPNAGDIVFLSTDDSGTASHVGIIESVETDNPDAKYAIHTIEGDVNNTVDRKEYLSANTRIVGYGNLGAAFDEYIQSFSATAVSLLSVDGFEFAATWDEAAKTVKAVNATYSGTGIIRGKNYCIQYSNDNGATWSADSNTVKAAKNDVPITLPVSDSLFDKNTAPLDTQFRLYNISNNAVTSNAFTIADVLDGIKPGFTDWLTNSYVQYFEGKEPTNTSELYDAFDLYYSLPTITLSQMIVNDTQIQLNLEIDREAEYTYEWEYLDDDNMWQSLTSDSSDKLLISDDLAATLAGGKEVHCKVYKDGQFVGVSNQLKIDPRQAEYDAAIGNINKELGLSSYGPAGADLSIGGYRFNTLFYYGNAKKDDRVPFNDAESYKNYLAQVYLDEGIDAVKKVWDYYLYDLYDPNHDLGYTTNINEGYPDAGTYGDQTLGWTKDAEKGSSTPFHSDVDPKVNDLNYDYLENGVDYSNFVTGLDKTAEAVSPGDSNTERKYDIDIIADAQAKVNAPVVLIFQIQTSWQMFDMLHANAVDGDGSTKVGACANNTELANLYDIKRALLRLVDYMDTNFPGSNLVMGITDVEHAGTFTMFEGTDSNGNPLFVTNDADVLREGIENWDTFGNCEHVHYTSTALTDAVANLQSNLYGWKDMYGYELQYEDIRKVGVIIGGPTENTDGANGYGTTLPWANFQQAQMNAIYGVRVNEGTPLNEDGYISCIDYEGNTAGTPFADGQGTAFTDRFVATNEDAVFNTLLNIVRKEMNAQGMDILNDEVFVENVTIEDTVTDEFIVNKNEPIVATIYAKDGVTVVEEKTVSLDGATVTEGSNGEIITISADGNLTITEYRDGTTKVAYNFGNVKNMHKAKLHFQTQAREDYIGSNNVFSNVGTPDLTYEHTPLDDDGNPTGNPKNFDVDCMDTPKVNVPIRFSTTDGESTTIFVGESVDLKDLSDAIVEDAEYRSELYDQINGKLTYEWTMPDGTTKVCGTVTIRNGKLVDPDFPDRSAIFNGEEVGSYTGTLNVTFAPEKTDDPNREECKPLTKPGDVWINVIDKGSTSDLHVRKDWPGGKGANTQVQFYVLANGERMTDEFGNDIIYTLNEANDWRMVIEDLPDAYVDESGNPIPFNYSLEEIVPPGYTVSYSKDVEVETTYKGQLTLSLTMSADLDKNKPPIIEYTYGGVKYKYQILKRDANFKKGETYTYVIDVDLLDGELQELGSDFKLYEFESTKLSDKGKATGKVEKVVAGKKETTVYVMSNMNGYELPGTGGVGTLTLTIGGLSLMAAPLLYGYLRRRRERRIGG